jgi:hypothetical protein
MSCAHRSGKRHRPQLDWRLFTEARAREALRDELRFEIGAGTRCRVERSAVGVGKGGRDDRDITFGARCGTV